MMIKVRDLCGLAGLPRDRTSASRWLRGNKIAVTVDPDDGRRPERIKLSDLPQDIRHAYLAREIERATLAPGDYDEAAHDAFLALPASMQAEAERKAAVARLLMKAGPEASQQEKFDLVHRTFGCKGNSKGTLKRILTTIEGVDPINFAPALAARHVGRTALADVNDELWDYALAMIAKAAPTHALTAIYDDMNEIARKRNLAWPSYSTFLRRWNALPEIERKTLRHGSKHAAKELYQSRRRTVAKLQALQVVEMDGRTLDVWALFEDGTVARPTILALVDRASFKTLHHVIGKSENALMTRDLILETCDRHGVFDTLRTDNSRSFSGLMIAGGVKHKFRNSGTRLPEWEPPGVCEHLGIELKYTLPHNPGAKIPESKFAKLSRRIDTRPEFAGGHSGHTPLEKPNDNSAPISIALVREIYAREIAKDNAKSHRRTENARRGESYDDTFKRLLKDRALKPMTPKQRWRASLLYEVRTVDRVGQIKVNGWVYGKDSLDGSQEYLMPYSGLPVLVGTDPSNYAAPAIAFDMDTLKEIMAGIQPDLAGDYMDQDGAREAGKERARLRKLTREIETSRVKDLAGIFAELNSDRDLARRDDPRRTNVLQPNFNDPLRNASDEPSLAKKRAERQQFLERQFANREKRKASGSNHQPF